jgi:hypothetical protein
VKIDETLSGPDYRSNVTNLVRSPADIEKAQNDFSFVLTPESKTELLVYIDKKQLSEKQDADAIEIGISELEKKADALEQQYSVLNNQFRSIEETENQKIRVELAVFSKEREANYNQSYNACRDTNDKQYGANKEAYTTQHKKLENEFKVEYKAIGAEKKQAYKLKSTKTISASEYEEKIRALDDRLSKATAENQRLKDIINKQKRDNDKISLTS